VPRSQSAVHLSVIANIKQDDLAVSDLKGQRDAVFLRNAHRVLTFERSMQWVEL
jgi:hypothetical protein